jgi:Zn-dependent protease with chaperone function
MERKELTTEWLCRFGLFAFPLEISINFILMVITLPALGIWVSLVSLFNINFNSIFEYLIPIITFVIFPFLIIFFYSTDSKRKIKKHEFKDLNSKYPDVSDFIAGLCKKIDINPVPKTLWNKAGTRDALVFGTHKQAYIVVSDGFCKDFKVFPEVVEVILLHELAHLKNKDLAKHALAENIWKSYLIITLIQATFLIYVSIVSPEIISESALRKMIYAYLIPGLLIFYLNSSIKKTREIHADLKVLSFKGTKEHIKQAFRVSALAPPKISFLRRIANFIKYPFSLSVIKRIKYAEDCNLLFEPNFERGLIVGVLTAFYAIALFYYSPLMKPLDRLMAIFPFGYLTIGYLLLSISLLPFWFSFYAWKNLRQMFKALLRPLTGWSIGFMVTFLFYFPFWFDFSIMAAWVSYFFCYYMLFILQFILTLFISIWQGFSIKIKLLIVTIILPLVLNFLLFLLANPEWFIAGVLGLILLAMFIFIATIKFALCPNCGKELWKSKFLDPFKCRSCYKEFDTI